MTTFAQNLLSERPPGSLVDVGLRQNEDGSPVRLRSNGRRRRPVGLYYSVKSGRHLPHESRAELHDLWCTEVDTTVVSSWPQPFTLHYVTEGKRRSYTPDRKDLLSDGSAQIIEVKHDQGALDDQYIEKLRCVATLLAHRGLAFVVRDRAEIEAEPRFAAIETVQRYRRTRIPAGDISQVQSLLDDQPRELGWVLQRLAPEPMGFATLCAMVVRRFVSIDLTNGLKPDAQLEWTAR